MDKLKLICDLFDDIKDNIEYDSDITAIYELIIRLLDYDEDLALKLWLYLVNKYDIIKLRKDIDFTLLLEEFPFTFLKRRGLKTFCDACFLIEKEKALYLKRIFFNVFNDESLILKLVQSYIKEEKSKKEKELIELIYKNSGEIPREVFDFATFIKKVIYFHLQYEKINVNFLLVFIDKVKNNKDKAVLKTLLIDYL